MKEAIDSLLKTYRIDKKMTEMDFLKSWEEVMGKAIAMRTGKIYLNGSILHVEITSPIMKNELMQARTRVIEMLNTKNDKKITDIWFI